MSFKFYISVKTSLISPQFVSIALLHAIRISCEVGICNIIGLLTLIISGAGAATGHAPLFAKQTISTTRKHAKVWNFIFFFCARTFITRTSQISVSLITFISTKKLFLTSSLVQHENMNGNIFNTFSEFIEMNEFVWHTATGDDFPFLSLPYRSTTMFTHNTESFRRRIDVNFNWRWQQVFDNKIQMRKVCRKNRKFKFIKWIAQ